MITTATTPSTMPAGWLIMPAVTTLNTRPSALICADTQPRYEATMQSLVTTSTGRL